MNEVPGSSTPDPVRPSPDRPFDRRLREWLAWFGAARLILTTVSVLVVAAGGFWLVKAPSPPVEATLPHAAEADVPTPSSVAAPSDAGSTVPGATGAVPGDARSQEGDVGPIVVHVAGRVEVPGIYELDSERRVNDAIERAGGATADADLDSVNLAQVLFDGQRLYVPGEGEVDQPVAGVVTPVVGEGFAEAEVPAGPVDVNRASVDELDVLPGVGPSTAKAIVDERNRNGPFATVDELERVPGIGPAKVEALRDLVGV